MIATTSPTSHKKFESDFADGQEETMPYLVKKLSASTFLFFLLLASVSQDSVQAQVLYGGLTGNVTDSTGAAVPGVLVSALHEETNQSRDAITNDVGRYTFAT